MALIRLVRLSDIVIALALGGPGVLGSITGPTTILLSVNLEKVYTHCLPI